MEAIRPHPIRPQSFSLDSPLKIGHKPLENGQQKPLTDYLTENGCDKKSVNILFGKDGSWGHEVDKHINPYELAPEQLASELARDLDHEYKATSASLNGIHPYGYTKHDMRHALWVAESSIYLLRQGGYDTDTQRIAVAAAALHDIGNIVSRPRQSETAIILSKRIFPLLNFNEKDTHRMKEAILHHSGSYTQRNLTGDIFLNDPPGLQWERMMELRNSRTPEALAVNMADKADISPKRVSDKENPKTVIDIDPHAAVNLLFESGKFTKKGETFIWPIVYKPQITDPRLNRYIAGNGTNAYVGEDAHEQYRREGLPHVYPLTEKLVKTYQDRLALAALSAYALFPDIEKVSIPIYDLGVARSGIVAEKRGRGIFFGKIGEKPTEHPIRRIN